MHWFLHSPGKAPLALEKPEYRIGSASDCDVSLPIESATVLCWRLMRRAENLWLESVQPDAAIPVCVNGRQIQTLALLQAGDELQFPGLNLRISTAEAPALAKISVGQARNFADRVLLRVWTGREAGKAYALVNSLCIGRSALSEIRIDDPAMAERHVLVQRQGNDILVKNLSPLLEMRVQGWVCTEARLAPGAFFSIEQHRFQLQAPWQEATENAEATAPLMQAVPSAGKQPTNGPGKPALFSRGQWLLLAVALAISGAFILVLTLSP
jgi:hypothetical protein